ncbi:type II toxin-antitoxin system HicA family toxin [Lactococcus sp. dk322]|uniref:type II toxin-antitoxin system HicA family toxin n=1 Tax=Lactococcus sp. dk322 TaxID=2603290 RepID=UPI0011C8F657|nr:type II toxin-antitoxin system HicA family toxin [Lactococcus sp. dk322]TXK46782.1 toxin-antitoxin system, toxin component, HicA family protein [Lactococcus sp. dk322]
MKTNEVKKLLKKNGWWKLREGSNHEIWTDGKNFTQVVRHPNMNDLTVKNGIIKKFGLKEK